MKALSRAISEWEATQFSVTVYESKGVVLADKFVRHLWKQFWGLFMSGKQLSFPCLFVSQQGCGG